MIAVYKRELRSYLTSMIGYLFIFFILLLTGIYFSAYQLGASYPRFEYTLSALTFVFLISVPILTMRVLAEERKQKTDQLLLTAPVSVEKIVLGKYLALVTIFAIPMLIMCFYPLLMTKFGTVSLGAAYTAVLGFFLLGCANLAIGVFISSLTESQVIAAVLTFVILFAFYMMNGISSFFSEGAMSTCITFGLLILAAAIMADEPVLIENLPDVNDINVMLEAIEGIGAMVQRIDRHTVKINGSTIGDFSIDYDYIKKIRASYYLLGALLGKYKRAEVALPGGCNIGSRPIDQHLKGFRALGADVDIEYGKIVAEAEHLKGTHLYFDVVTVGATINVMMAAAMADGITIMENVAKEPHVVDVANFLNSMGANIRGAGTDVIKIRGVKSLHKAEYSIIPDQIEAGTFMFAAAATRGDVTVLNVIPKHLDATISKLIDIGCEVEEFDDAVRVVAKGRLKSTQVKTLPYPGYPTDMQPQIGVVLALASGTSTITESIFENRFKYLDELARMGANIKVEGNSATIEGVEKFSAARVSAPDLRAGAALCIAGLATDGITIVDDIVYIQRGYERFEEKLRSLGGIIEKVSSEKEIQKFRLKVG